MKEGDLILVSAEATGLGKPMEAVIDKIETFMGQTLVTVTYTQPDDLSGQPTPWCLFQFWEDRKSVV